MGSKLSRKNKALKKLQTQPVDSVTELTEDVEEGLSQRRESRYRMESKEGHFVILFAWSLEHAQLRWKEFYKNVDCETCQRLNPYYCSRMF